MISSYDDFHGDEGFQMEAKEIAKELEEQRADDWKYSDDRDCYEHE